LKRDKPVALGLRGVIDLVRVIREVRSWDDGRAERDATTTGWLTGTILAANKESTHGFLSRVVLYPKVGYHSQPSNLG
jgi:hypothetical protein